MLAILGRIAVHTGKKSRRNIAMNSQDALGPDPASYHFDLVTPIMEVATPGVTSFE